MTKREKVNILLVDDQPAKLLSLEVILADLDENVLKANSADEALKMLLANDIAVVLIDVCMPKMDGFELAELVRDHPRFGRTAIIFISAVHLTDADRLRGYGLGAVDYIPVPIIPEVLRAKVAVFAELFRKTDQLEQVNRELEKRVAELAVSNERLRLSDRMATIGTLSAGLGHDMGNLLLPIRMRLAALESYNLSDVAREDVAAIHRASEYLQRLAASLRLLALDPHQEMIADATDLASWWYEAESMIRNCVPLNVRLFAQIPEGLPPVRIARAGLAQVVFNLVQNAGDALQGRQDGYIIVSAELSLEGEAVRLSVVDNGCGMNEETRRRCMEPFFTTKTRGLSTGLGLALVGGIMKNMNGEVAIETELGKGTAFRLSLPMASPASFADDARNNGHISSEHSARGSLTNRTASVLIEDRLLTAHVRSVLLSLDLVIRDDQPDEAHVWVRDVRSDADADDVRRFLDTSEHRRAVVFGMNGSSAHDGRLICLERGVKPSVLRSRIYAFLGAPTKTRKEYEHV